MLKDSQCNEIADPYQMAGMLWNSYKDHMGHFEGISVQFDLQVLLNKVDGLDDLTLPFQEKKNDVIKAMPADRAPGPDGFNGLFLRTCWHLIKKDFYKLDIIFKRIS
jgi:hypothetical protein